MDDDDDDAHHPYHQLRSLYETDFQRGEENENDDGEEDNEEDNEEEDDDEDEEDDEGELEPQCFEQDFELGENQSNRNLHRNVVASGALTLSQPDNGFAGVRTTDGDKHTTRDDWTEAATHILLEAWGDRYVQLNKGNLKQEDWEEVAEVVSALSKVHKTDVQCKNRLDTLKKKYKVEKQKQSAIGSSDSKWPFYKQLDKLLSATAKRAGIPGAVDAGQPVKSALDRGDFNKVRKYKEEDPRTPNNTSSSSKPKESPEMTFSSPRAWPDTDGTQTSRKRKTLDGAAFKTLAKAITKFGEIYEKMENSKQQQMMNLEKIRMEFTRDLELQRMQLFMQTQVEIAKMKHSCEMDPTASNLSG